MKTRSMSYLDWLEQLNIADDSFARETYLQSQEFIDWWMEISEAPPTNEERLQFGIYLKEDAPDREALWEPCP